MIIRFEICVNVWMMMLSPVLKKQKLFFKVSNRMIPEKASCDASVEDMKNSDVGESHVLPRTDTVHAGQKHVNISYIDEVIDHKIAVNK